MNEQQNIALVKRGLEAAVKGDYDTLRTMLNDDVSYSGPFQPEMHGVDEVIAGMRQWDELGYRWEQEYEGAWADENRVVVLNHVKLSRDSRTLDTHEVQIVELRGGKASKLTEYASEPEKLSQFMS